MPELTKRRHARLHRPVPHTVPGGTSSEAGPHTCITCLPPPGFPPRAIFENPNFYEVPVVAGHPGNIATLMGPGVLEMLKQS